MLDKKVKLDANFAGFAILHPLGPVLPANEKKVEDSIAEVLKKYYFPVVNIVYSAAGETRCNPEKTKIEFVGHLKKLVLEGEVITADVTVADIQPCETEVSSTAKTALGQTGSFLSESGGILATISPLVPLLSVAAPLISGIGLVLKTFFSYREKGIVIPYLSGSQQFGWRRQELQNDHRRCEGIYYAQVILAVEREKASPKPDVEFFIELKLELLQEWEPGGLQTNSWGKKGIGFQVPKPPETPDIGKTAIPYNPDSVPLTFSEEEAAKLLGLPGRALPPVLTEVLLPIPGSDPPRFTKGALLKFLGLK
jgi:hypothetical protein